ncbi:cell division protein FtsA [Alkalicoccus luteus]|uniref:Cell division protein FtsA n=1 Tax=Alkalicoccus luteus TaxID=1237094 RepID=A0A969PLK6_9BACI|nr:cell division protein FtsA [Alkalicoccus luteus]NJP36440.1 cell division protein FtsA [Alkalicoccus luteus]
MNYEHTYVTLDIGTSNVRVVIGEVSSGALNIIGVGEVPSSGLRKGAIVDIDETVRSIKEAVAKAERMIGMEIRNVIVGVTGNHIKLQPCHGVVAVSSEHREIGDEDVNRVIDAAQVMSIPPDREIIDVVPKQFIVDGLDEINDPRGMIGVRLEMEGLIVTGSRTVLHNLLRCVEKAGLTTADIVLEPLAAGAIALSKDEKSLGVGLIDLGGGSTTISVFQQGALQAVRQIPVGGTHIANDISVGLRTSTEEAEEVKVQYGHALIEEASDDEMFEVSEIGSDQPQEFSQWQLANVIEPRAEEIFMLVEQELRRMGYDDLPGGFVLTGGNAKIPGMLDLARDIFQQNVRISVPDYIGVREPQYTNGVGLITFAHKNARIQGKDLDAGLESSPVAAGVQEEPRRERERPRPQAKKPAKTGPGLKKRVSSMFKSFLE